MVYKIRLFVVRRFCVAHCSLTDDQRVSSLKAKVRRCFATYMRSLKI